MALVGSNSKTLNKEKLSYPLKKRDISFQRIHFLSSTYKCNFLGADNKQ